MIKSNNKNFLILLFSLLIVQIIWLVYSPGFYFIDDGCHYVYNRHFYQMPIHIISSWARLGRVILYALPAQINYRAVQILSALIFDLTVYIGYRILKFKNVSHPEWAIIAIGFQPVLFNLSYTAMAELPTAFLIILSYYFFIREKYVPAIILSSMIFLFRTEYFFVCLLFVLVLLFQKKWYAIPLSLIGPAIWFFTILCITKIPSDFISIFGLHSQLPRVGEGIKWYHYIIYSPKTFGIIQTLFFFIGIAVLIRKKKFNEWVLALLIIIGGIAGHTLAALDTFNATCSVGQIRYISVVGPMVGLLSVVGISYVGDFFKWKYLKVFFSVILLLLMFFAGPFITPFHTKYEIDYRCEDIAKLRDDKYKDYPVMTDLYQIAITLDMPYMDYDYFHKMRKSTLHNLDKAIIVWEKSLDGTPFTDSDLMLRDIEADSNVRLIDSIKVFIDHKYDIPIFKLKDNFNHTWQPIMEYLTSEQYSDEDLYLKVFIKSNSNDNIR